MAALCGLDVWRDTYRPCGGGSASGSRYLGVIPLFITSVLAETRPLCQTLIHFDAKAAMSPVKRIQAHRMKSTPDCLIEKCVRGSVLEERWNATQTPAPIVIIILTVIRGRRKYVITVSHSILLLTTLATCYGGRQCQPDTRENMSVLIAAIRAFAR